MVIPTKKLKNGFELPVYGLGTWQMGGRRERDLKNDDAADIRAIQQAIEAGITHIDTAEGYANGHAEELIAQAIEEKAIDRHTLFLASKVRCEHQGYDDLLRACEASLKRLNTEYLDLYLLHSFADQVSLKDTIRALNTLKDQGLVRHIGVSNFDVEQLREAQGYATSKVVCNQVYYNLRVREIERRGLLEYCQHNDVMVVAYRPTEKSQLLIEIPPVVDTLCKKYDKTPVQIALSWLVSQPNVVTLAKTRNPLHLEENLGALDWTMDPEDVEMLRRDFPNQVDVSDLIVLGGKFNR